MSNKVKYSKPCVIWTRVSTKYQEDNGGSLQYQKDCCIDYANANGFTVIENGFFGGSHESAKTPGKFINEMMNAVRRTNSAKYVIVSQIDRFSRDAGQGISMFKQLLEKGVVIVEATSGMRTDDHNQKLMLEFKLCMAEWDNANRTDKFTKGRVSCLKSGVYCGAVPIGYDKFGKSRNRTFKINEDGELIKKAFRWKLQGLANCQIIDKLRPLGLHLTKQKLHKILTNPFYAGKIVHKMLQYEMIDGNQPPIISYKEFLKVQEILSGRTGVYKHQQETPQFPLKRHVKCACDGTLLTAYTVKKKGIDYYKCNCIGCKTNISAKKLHNKYCELLNSYDIPQVLIDIVRDSITSIISKAQSEKYQDVSILKKKKSELENKIKKCKERFACGEIDSDIYESAIGNLQTQLNEVILELSKHDKDLSNLNKKVNDIIIMCCHLGTFWKNASIETAQKLQNLIFPDGILWDKEIDGYRTISENEALAIIRRISNRYKNENEENSSENSSLVNLCA